MRKWTAVGLSSVATAALVLVGPAWAQATGQASAAPMRGTDRNVMITLKVAKTGAPDAGSRVYRLVAQVGGPAASMLMGWRMPIPTGPKKSAGSDVQAAPSFTYQNIGVTAHLVRGGGRTLLIDTGTAEVSGLGGKATYRPLGWTWKLRPGPGSKRRYHTTRPLLSTTRPYRPAAKAT